VSVAGVCCRMSDSRDGVVWGGQFIPGEWHGKSWPRTESKMGVMAERRRTRRYDLTLAISIRFRSERTLGRQDGKTKDISTRGVYFVIDKDMDAGSELDMTLTLPAEFTNDTDVYVRVQGKVVRVERRLEEGEPRLGVAAVIERYDIIRGEIGRPAALTVK